jgi:diketogulonate reductase-like aldo/keto reductase
MSTRGKFDVPSIEASLAESLRRLRTDYVDLLLLHEVASDDLTDEVLACLDAWRREGVVRAIGTGTSYANTAAIRAAYPDFFDVWQYSWSVLDRAQPKPVAFSITHRAIQRALSPLRDWLGADAARAQRLSAATGIDLSAKRELGFVLIGAAMINNPGGITLVSSRQPSHIEANARQLSDRGALDTAARFMQALAAEPDVPNA